MWVGVGGVGVLKGDTDIRCIPAKRALKGYREREILLQSLVMVCFR